MTLVCEPVRRDQVAFGSSSTNSWKEDSNGKSWPGYDIVAYEKSIQTNLNAKKPNVVKNPGKVRARTYGTKSPSRSEALRFINSAKSPSTKIDGSMVNFRGRLSNEHRSKKIVRMRRTPKNNKKKETFLRNTKIVILQNLGAV